MSLSGNKNPNWRGGKPSCSGCGKTIFYGHKRCSDCHLKSIGGSNNPHWKGGKTNVLQLIRSVKKYQNWRKDILKRDNFKCQKCGSCEQLEVHHKRSLFEVIDSPSLLWDLDNGVTLCSPCHESTKNKDNKGRYVRQLAEK